MLWLQFEKQRGSLPEGHALPTRQPLAAIMLGYVQFSSHQHLNTAVSTFGFKPRRDPWNCESGRPPVRLLLPRVNPLELHLMCPENTALCFDPLSTGG